MKLVIHKGEVRAVYGDCLQQLGLGPMVVERASSVEFDHKKQEWEAVTPQGELISHGPSRDQVIRDEVRVIESRL